jgi:hypothetical protein
MSQEQRKPDVDSCTENERLTEYIAPPDQPGEYRITRHFRERLLERVPEAYQATLPENLIRQGTVKKLDGDATDNDYYGKPVAFTTVGPEQKPWTLVAGLRHETYVNSDVLTELFQIDPSDIQNGRCLDADERAHIEVDLR